MTQCSLELEVVTAARTGCWTTELRTHWATCQACAEAALIAEVMRCEPELEIPAAGLVYFKAELRRRQELMDRALSPVKWAERVVVAAGLLVSAGGLAWSVLASAYLGWTAIAGTVLLGAITAFSLRSAVVPKD